MSTGSGCPALTTRPKAVVVSGHMVDAPDRPTPRFPPGQVPGVAEVVRRQLERWDVGRGTTLITGGARGADIIAAEALGDVSGDDHVVVIDPTPLSA